MDYFQFKKGILYCEGLSVENLAKKYGTPLFVYSKKTILKHFFELRRAFQEINPLICYSVKANPNLSILKLLVSVGSGLDIVSGGELYRAKKIKCPAKRIVYASVGKTDQEIEEAIKANIFMFNVESESEIQKISSIAAQRGKFVKVSLRINPDVEPKTHNYIITGRKNTKFGIDCETAREIILGVSRYKNIIISGIHLHIGSQITESEPFVLSLKKTRDFIKSLPKTVNLEFINIGGGLGIVYDQEKPQTAYEFAKDTKPLLKEIGLKVILEPGRFIVGNAGVLVTKVLYNKEGPSQRFIIVDAAMNDLLRPSLYKAYHKIIPVDKRQRHFSQSYSPADIVGPVCESGDFLGKQRKLKVKEGKYLAIFGAGAYGSSMSSNYNSRCRCPEILVQGKRSYLVRKREEYRDLIAKEVIV